jgi:hypothetical protein
MAVASDGFASWYNARVTPMQRSLGQSSVAAAAYRLGERLHDERLDIVHDYRARSGVVDAFTIVPDSAPAWARDPHALWNAAEAAERSNGRVARELKLALPHRASDADRRLIVERVAWMLVERYGVGVTAAIHAPPDRGTGENDHAHILFTTRKLTADGLAKKKERGVHSLDDLKQGPEEITYIRMQCAAITNQVLEAAGSSERVTHLSMAERGLEDEPGVHHGPRLTQINDERKKRGLDPLEPYMRAKEYREQWQQMPKEWVGVLVEGHDQAEALSSDQTAPLTPEARAKRRIDQIAADLSFLQAEIVLEEERELDRKYGTSDRQERAAKLGERRDPAKGQDPSNAAAPFVFVERKPLTPREAAETRAAAQGEPYRVAIRSGQGVPDLRNASGIALKHIVQGVRRIGRMAYQAAHDALRFLESSWSRYMGIGSNPWRVPDRDAREHTHEQEHER